jgi:hypothetical protein
MQPRLARSFYPLAGVIVYDGETLEQAFRRTELCRAKHAWQEAEAALHRAAAACPWWEEPIPEGRS